MLAASERCTPFEVKMWFAQRRQNGTGELSALAQVQLAQQKRIARLDAQQTPDPTHVPMLERKLEPEPENVPEPVRMHLDFDLNSGVEVLSPQSPQGPDTPTQRRLRKLEEQWQRAAHQTAAAGEAASLRIGSPYLSGSSSLERSIENFSGVRHTSSAPAALSVTTGTQDMPSKDLALTAVQHMNLSAFWVVQVFDKLAGGNLAATMRKSAPELSRCGATSRQLFPDAENTARKSALENSVEKAQGTCKAVRSRLCGLVTLLDQSMFHLSQSSFAEFDGDFHWDGDLGPKRRVAWGPKSPTKISVHSTHQENAACVREIEVMSADELLSRLQLDQHQTHDVSHQHSPQSSCESSGGPQYQRMTHAAPGRATNGSPPVVLLPEKPPLLLVRCMPAQGQPAPRLLTAVSATLRFPAPAESAGGDQQSAEVVGGYKVGDLCEIFSRSGQVWCPGEVKAVRSVNTTLHVEYLPPGAGEGGERSKMIKADSVELRHRENKGKAHTDKTKRNAPWIEWTPKSEYFLGQIGEVVVYDANGAGMYGQILPVCTENCIICSQLRKLLPTESTDKLQ